MQYERVRPTYEDLLEIQSVRKMVSVASGNSSVDEPVVISMERRGTGDLAPVYSLTISSDGTVMYDGIKNVKIKGLQRTHISEKSVEELVHEFINIYYFALKDRYGESDSSNQPFTLTSISMARKSKKVIHHHGSLAPQGLSALEDKIDAMTGSSQWTGMHD